MDSIFYVYEPSTGYTKYQHNARAEAEKEAERLALINPGKEFIILVSISKCIYKPIIWESVETIDPDVPF